MVRFDLLVPEGCLMGVVLSCVDVLREANSLARASAGRRIAPVVSWRLLTVDGEPSPAQQVAHVSEEERMAALGPCTAEVVVVPPLMMITIPGLRRLVSRNQAACALLATRRREGAWISACGSGVWLLARAGVLEQQLVPLPWIYQSSFAREFPSIRIASEAPMIVGDRIVMVSAPSQSHELLLRLLECVGLADLASPCRYRLTLNAERQRLVTMLPEQVVGVSRYELLQRSISWMEINAGNKISVDDVAQAAAVSTRTLVRLFRRHLDRSPQQFLNELRVERAKMWLEVTRRSIQEISMASGYDDPASFRRVFHRHAGMSPAEYRQRFTMRAPSAARQMPAFDDVLADRSDSAR